jgi:hypothetical protein
MAPFPTAALQHFSFSNTTLPSIILEVACTSAGKKLEMAKELPCPIELTPHDIMISMPLHTLLAVKLSKYESMHCLYI